MVGLFCALCLKDREKCPFGMSCAVRDMLEQLQTKRDIR